MTGGGRRRVNEGENVRCVWVGLDERSWVMVTMVKWKLTKWG